MVVAQRVRLLERLVGDRFVHRCGRAVQERLGPPAVRHQQAGALHVDGQVVVEVRREAVDHRKVQHMREIVGQRAELVASHVQLHAAHAGRLHALPIRILAEPRDAPHFIVRGQRPGDGKRHLAGRTGYQNLLSLQDESPLPVEVERRRRRYRAAAPAAAMPAFWQPSANPWLQARLYNSGAVMSRSGPFAPWRMIR